METVVGLLTTLPRDEVLAAGDGLTAGRLLETAQAYLESRSTVPSAVPDRRRAHG